MLTEQAVKLRSQLFLLFVYERVRHLRVDCYRCRRRNTTLNRGAVEPSCKMHIARFASLCKDASPVARKHRSEPVEELRKWLNDHGLTQMQLMDLMRAKARRIGAESALAFDGTRLSRVLCSREEPPERIKLLIENIVGIPAWRWLPPAWQVVAKENVRLARKSAPGKSEARSSVSQS